MDTPYIKLFKIVDGELIFVQDFQFDSEMFVYRDANPEFNYQVIRVELPAPIPPLVIPTPP